MNKYRKLGKNVILITIGNFGSKVLSFFLIPLYTAILTTSEYGIADLMTTTVNLLYPFFSLIISEAVIRFALDKDYDKAQVFSIGLIITIVGFLFMLCLSPVILLIDSVKPYFAYFILYYFVVCIHTLLSQFARGIEKIGLYSLCGVLQTFVFICLNLVFLLWLKIGLQGYLYSLILSNAFAILFLIVVLRIQDYLVGIKQLERAVATDMLRYSIPLIPNSISWWVSNSSDKYILTYFKGVSITGIYSVAQVIPTIFSVMSTVFMGAWQISAVDGFGSEESRIFYSNIYKRYSSINIIIVALLICCSKILATLLFSKDFYQAWLYAPVLLFASMFNAMGGFLGTIYTSSKKTMMLLVSTVVAATTNIVLNIVFIPTIGAMGAAIATFFSYFSIWIMRLIDTRKILRIDIDWKRDVISYLLIIIQIVLLMLDNAKWFVVCCILFGIIVLVNRDCVSEIINKLSIIINKKVNKL